MAKSRDAEVDTIQRIRAAERELVALCNRHRVALVYEEGTGTQGPFQRFTFRDNPNGARHADDPVTAKAP